MSKENKQKTPPKGNLHLQCWNIISINTNRKFNLFFFWFINSQIAQKKFNKLQWELNSISESKEFAVC